MSLLLALLGYGNTGKTSEEKVEFTKGNYKTTVILTFAEDGNLMYTHTKTEYVASEEEMKQSELRAKREELEKKFKRALRLDTPEGYRECAEIRKQLEELNQQQPT